MIHYNEFVQCNNTLADKVQKAIEYESIIVIYSLPSELDQRFIAFFEACQSVILSQRKINVNFNGFNFEISSCVKFILIANKSIGTITDIISNMFNVIQIDCPVDAAYNYLRVLFIDKGSNQN